MQQYKGLTSAKVQERIAQGQVNTDSAEKGKTTPRILFENIFTLFNLLNLAIAAVLLAVGSYRNMLFMGVVISNTLIGSIQEIRARNTLRKLNVLSRNAIHVIRDGKDATCYSDELVQDDVCVFKIGSQICADAIVLEGFAGVNESLLTGESDIVEKHVGDTLLSGSFVVEGDITCRLTKVGEACYAQQLVKDGKAIKKDIGVLMASMKRIVKITSILLVPLGIALFFRQTTFFHAGISEAVPVAAAAMIGMLPEGLMLLSSMSLALGVVNLGKQHILVSQLYAIEALARVDVLCLDKTGTLTTGEMRLTGTALEKDGFNEAIGYWLSAFKTDSSPTHNAVSAAYQPQAAVPDSTVPFSSKRKWSGAYFKAYGSVVVGAPEFLITDAALIKTVDTYAAGGSRVLAVLKADAPFNNQALPENMQPLGLLLIQDVLRPGVNDTLAFFTAQGVTLKVISGDNPVTVSHIATSAGVPNAQHFIDTRELQTPAEILAASKEQTVFGRVSPEMKKQLVLALQSQKHTVAMTGDGVNDIPALKTANCGIAIPGGADAVKYAAHLTLLNGSFASLPQAVYEGRRVINNITRAASLFLVKTLFSLALTALLLIIRHEYPFQPIQLTLISAFAIGIPTFFLTFAPNKSRVQGDFLSNVLINALPGAISVLLCVMAILSFSAPLKMDASQISTLCTYATGFCCLMTLFITCLPLNLWRLLLVGTMTAAFLSAALLFPHFFFFVSLTTRQLLLLACLCPCAAACTLLIRRVLSRISAARQQNP